MVKASDRVREYHPRAPHKEGCACAPCKAKRGEGKAPPPTPAIISETPPAPATCLLSDLNTKDMFKIGEQMYRLGNKTEEIGVCAMLKWVVNGTDSFDQYWGVIKVVSLGLNTVVTKAK